ncbi:PREDICTED: aminopeptidase N-like [Branchiostoma belcheri]|uniref:Aminopeptidase n=1 Tax=Branchiostoma belcheri TaxID=7741 RepID=A0A6P4ZQI8_BRABE|nr:PREDICTED: aminopeptidase N-like [Branchiostoma belcheri]
MGTVAKMLLMVCLLPLLRNVEGDLFEQSQALAEISHTLEDLEDVEQLLERKREEEILQSARLPNNVVPLHYDLRLEVDLQKFEVIGRVAITVRCDETSSYILLHTDKIEIVGGVSRPRLQGQDGGDTPTITSWSLHPENDFLLLKLDGDLIKDGVYIVRIHFRNVLRDQLIGHYRSSYLNGNKEKRYLATTQFEPTGARKAFPCFDEPELKATFKVTLVHQTEYHAMSNMPIERSVKGKDGWVTDHFLTSPKMATYLVAFVVSDFTSVRLTTQSGIEIRALARPQAIAEGKGAYALDIAGKILPHFEEYLGVPYSLPKLDLAAIPDFPMGGMENWGLIVMTEDSLLYDAKIPSAAAKENVIGVVSHELGHMWFGDLVTMKWWDGLWLNEGITTYMGQLGTDFAEPDMKIMDMFTSNVRRTMEQDSLSSSRPVYQPVHRPSQIAEIFDGITYTKGAAVVRMLHHAVGDTAFRRAFKSYLQKYAYGNTVQDQLWAEFTKALNAEGREDLDVKVMMDTWILQKGYPVITFARDYSSGKAEVTQQHFLKDASVSTKAPGSKSVYKWYVPVSFTTQSTGSENPKSVWMKPTSDTEVIDLEGADADDWMLGNVGRVGYYRVNYDINNWRLLINHLKSDEFRDIPVVNRGTLVDDALSLAGASMLDITVALDLSQYLVRERSYVAWDMAESALRYIGDNLGTNNSKKWKDYMGQLITPFYNDVSWTDEAGTFQEEMGQALAVRSACRFDQADCLARSKSMFKRWMDTNNNSHIPERLKTTVYCTAIHHGGKAEWEFAWQQYRQAADGSGEQNSLFRALSCSQDADILKTHLEQSLDSKLIRKQKSAEVVENVALNREGKYLAWEFFVGNWEFYFKSFNEVTSLGDTVTVVTSQFSTDKDLEKLLSFTKDRNLGSATRAFQQAIESTQRNIRWRQNNEDKVEKWLEEN